MKRFVVRLTGLGSAIGDQIIYSASQLALTFLLARVLTLQEFGSFSTVLSIIAFQYILHNAFVHEPLLIYRAYSSKRAALCGWFIIVAVTCSAMLFWHFSSRDFSGVWCSLMLVFGFQCYWIFRSICTVRRSYIVLCIVGLLVLAYYVLAIKWIVPVSWKGAALLIAAGQLMFFCAVVWSFRHVLLTHQTKNKMSDVGDGLSLKKSVIYGSQASLSQCLSWIMTGGAIIYLGSVSDGSDAAFFKVYITLLLPMQYILSAIGYYLLPGLARSWKARETAQIYRSLGGLIIFGVVASFVVGSLFFFFGYRLVPMLFGASYARMDFSPFIYAPPIFGLAMCFRTAFRAAAQPTALLFCSVIGALVFIVCLAVSSGPIGYVEAVNAMTVGFAIMTVSMLLFVIHFIRRLSFES